jgi:NAD-dependent deacetylase
MDKYQELNQIIKKSKNVVFFGGAGVSTASGIKDFRSKDGLYHVKSVYGEPYEVMLSRSYYYAHTDKFYDFYKNIMINKEAKPNLAHITLSNFEKQHNLTIITQNIDGLHQEAGSKNVIELHGSVKRNYCEKCHKFYSLDDILSLGDIPKCSCGGIIKPDVVLYEEPLDENSIYSAIKAISNADVLIVGGTSLAVYPAASYIQYFNGDTLVIINKEPTPADSSATYVFHEDIGSVLNKILI